MGFGRGKNKVILKPIRVREIVEAVERAKIAYEIAAHSLFKDVRFAHRRQRLTVSSYSFDNYRRELATDLTLADLQKFTSTFLARPVRDPALDVTFNNKSLTGLAIAARSNAKTIFLNS